SDGTFASPIDTVITSLTPEIVSGGTYILRLEHSGGCIVQDTVVVDDIRNTNDLVADAGSSQLFNFGTTSLTLGDTLTSSGTNIIYEWTSTDDGLISPAFTNVQFAEVRSAGTYVLAVTDIQTACVARDTITIAADESRPEIDVNAIDFISCRTTEVPLNITVTNSTNFTIVWSRTDGNGTFPADQVNEQNPVVTEAGTYEVIVTDTNSGCSAIEEDIVVMENLTTPVAEAGMTDTLGCTVDAQVQLSADGSTETGVTYSWSDAIGNMNPGILSGQSSATPIIINEGTYILEVTQNSTGCVALDSVLIVPTQDLPEIVLGNYEELPCSGGSVEVDASNSTVGTFIWTQLSGPPATISGSTTPTASIRVPGTYRVRLESNDGCIVQEEFEVVQGDTSAITLNIDVPLQELTCANPTATITIDAEWSGGTPDFSYQFIPRQNSPTLPDAPEVTLSAAGIYDVQVTENNSMCTRTQLIAVGENFEVSPVIIANDNYELKCDGTAVVPEVNATQLGFNENVAWINAAADTIGRNLAIDLTEVGTYTFAIINPANACISDTTITVASASDVMASIDAPALLTCTNTQVTLNAFSSTTGSTITYNWDGPSFFAGQDTETPVVDTAGTYTLLVTDTATQCTATASIIVNEDITTPTIDLASTVDLGCETRTTIGGGTTATGDSISYLWKNSDDEPLGSDLVLEVSSAGNYTLEVSNATNGCMASESIEVTQNLELVDADAG
ncbi:MAG: hypothetical protein AAF738_08370, partial [Bacteroidota bacterium]